MGMKRILAFLFLISSVFGLSAANPSGTGAVNRVVLWNANKNLTNSAIHQIDTNKWGLGGTNFCLENDVPRRSMALGESSLYRDSGLSQDSTAMGYTALRDLVNASGNSAFGSFAMELRITGNGNSAFGSGALEFNTNGSRNVAVGINSMVLSPTGSDNTAVGANSLENTRSLGNTAIGSVSMFLLEDGAYNVGVGINTLANTVSQSAGTAIGSFSLDAQTTGTTNTALGFEAGTVVQTSAFLTLLGAQTRFNGAEPFFNSTAIGFAARIYGNNQMILGNPSVTDVITPGRMTATNGFGSYSTIATNQIPTTGWTNNEAINVTVYTTATAVSFTINNRAGTVLYTSPTLTATIPVNLQPGWSVRAASGLTGTVLPF